ncbi:hypothetical protein AQUCO_11000021v1 [Aquilegia coerulea]|uniref:Uncharacterized protein n=1 Tax=Aquilegia coerulea TaxID=218851 RepID=A0A2G5C2U5_AQUCA|nr:hypothetical protein AQUCO_11000021v1 [Aquilegia coerulea]
MVRLSEVPRDKNYLEIHFLNCGSLVLDTDGFVIPSLGIEDSEISQPDVSEVKNKPSSPNKVTIEEDKIYLGPHGAPPSQVKQQELATSGRKQRFKQKLREADRKFTGSGRENKVENLRELVGSSKGNATMPKSSARDWLDPHCHESQFQRSYSQ